MPVRLNKQVDPENSLATTKSHPANDPDRHYPTSKRCGQPADPEIPAIHEQADVFFE